MIVRSQVCAVHRDSSMSYQFGLAFDVPIRIDRPRGDDSPADGVPAGDRAEPDTLESVQTPVDPVNEW